MIKPNRLSVTAQSAPSYHTNAIAQLCLRRNAISSCGY